MAAGEALGFFSQDSISSSFCRRGPLAAPPIDGVNFKPSVTPFSCHDDFRGFGWRLCLLLCVFFLAIFVFLPFVFSLKFTYIIVIAVQGILMETVNFLSRKLKENKMLKKHRLCSLCFSDFVGGDFQFCPRPTEGGIPWFYLRFFSPFCFQCLFSEIDSIWAAHEHWIATVNLCSLSNFRMLLKNFYSTTIGKELS